MERQIEDRDQVLNALAEIGKALEVLSNRVTALEALAGEPSSAVGQSPEANQVRMINEEVVLIISGAIAAFLGEKPRIRQIRLLGGKSWSEQGRATIQASHALRIRRE